MFFGAEWADRGERADGNVFAGDAVFATASGDLGVALSSARLKRDGHDMATSSHVLMDLPPVTFLVRAEVPARVTNASQE